MALSHEEELARRLAPYKLNRRQVLAIGVRLGLGATSLGALLAACGQAPAATNAPTAAPAATAAPAPAVEPTQSTSLYDANDTADGPWPTNATGDPTSKVEISVAHAWDATFFERQKQFDTLFMQRHPNIVVKAENTPWGDFRQKYLAQAAGGALPDLFYIHFSWAQDLIKNGTVLALDDFIAKEKDFNIDDFTKPSLPGYRRDGKLWVIPYDEGPGILFYNKDIFDKAGVAYPDDTWTLETFKETAGKLTSGEGQSKIFGFSGTPSPGDSLLAPPFLTPFGASYLDEKESQYLLSQPDGVQTMEWWMEFRTKLNAVPSPAEQQALSQANINAFQVGRVAMILDGSWATPGIVQNANFKWDVAAWPKGPVKHATFSAGSGYGIASTSKNVDASWIYLNEYLSSAGQIYMWGSTGRGSPSRNSAWPSYLTSKFAPANAKVVQDSLNNLDTTGKLFQSTTPRVTQEAGPIWDLVVAGQLSVKDAIDQIGVAIEPIIAENRA
jgi:multiple sugar transport system substrate-binding protein